MTVLFKNGANKNPAERNKYKQRPTENVTFLLKSRHAKIIETGIKTPYEIIFKDLNTTNKKLKAEIEARTKAEKEKENVIQELKDALSEVKTLSGLLPICSFCKKIRDDKGCWNQIEAYIGACSDAKFSHSICQECAKKHYPDFDI